MNNSCSSERSIISGVYRHFKGRYYFVNRTVIHSETKEILVEYEALYGNRGHYVRPLDMFLSEVDHEKYPDVDQKWRFQLVATTFEELLHHLREEWDRLAQES